MLVSNCFFRLCVFFFVRLHLFCVCVSTTVACMCLQLCCNVLFLSVDFGLMICVHKNAIKLVFSYGNRFVVRIVWPQTKHNADSHSSYIVDRIAAHSSLTPVNILLAVRMERIHTVAHIRCGSSDSERWCL